MTEMYLLAIEGSEDPSRVNQVASTIAGQLGASTRICRIDTLNDIGSKWNALLASGKNADSRADNTSQCSDKGAWRNLVQDFNEEGSSKSRKG